MSRPIRLDGRLDDADWSTADSIAELVQIEPVEGGVAGSRTVAGVLASEDDLSFGIHADNPDPSRITAFARARDTDLANEDHLNLALDA